MRITQKIRDFANNVKTFRMNNSTLKTHFTHFKQKIQICELLLFSNVIKIRTDAKV